MKSPSSLTAACFFFVLLAFSTTAQTNKITAAEAKDHVGEVRTICGKVASTHFAGCPSKVSTAIPMGLALKTSGKS
jgi:hypothetical protein